MPELAFDHSCHFSHSTRKSEVHGDIKRTLLNGGSQAATITTIRSASTPSSMVLVQHTHTASEETRSSDFLIIESAEDKTPDVVG